MSFYMRHVEREILSALIDGELDATERRFVHEHLQQCAECREAAEEFTSVHGLIGELPRLVAPEAFVSKALAPPRRTRARAVTSVALAGKRRWVAAGIALAAAGITLAGLFTPPPSTTPPVDEFVTRHVSVHSAADVGGQVLFAVNGR
jgi:anti-sigma factor RsiW